MSLLTITDSIGIEILNPETILTSVGNELRLCAPDTTRLLSQRLRCKVHGIVRGLESTGSAKKVLVYGEKEFMLLESTDDENEPFKQLHNARLTDWICAACFLSDSKEFVLLTAHNVLLRLTYDEKNSTQDVNDEVLNICRISERYSCNDKSTLYCAHLHGNTWEQLVVFGGNAFGELLIWRPSESAATSADNKPIPVALLQRTQLHKGVIFSIDYNAEFKLLTTTSDDRSIRLLSVENENWQECNLKTIASSFGHRARVFQGKIVVYNNEPYAISAGEDSNICVWRRTGESLHKHRIQLGAVVWNFVYESTSQTLYTVGSMGNVIPYYLKDVFDNKLHPADLLTFSTPDPKEYVAKVKFLSANTVIGITNKHQLVYAMNSHQCNAINVEWEWHIAPVEFEPYMCTVLEAKFEEYVVLCGYKRITLLRYNKEDTEQMFIKLFDGDIMNGLIRSFHILNDNNFLVCDALGNCLLLKGEDFLTRYDIPLPNCKEPWLTAAVMLGEELLLVGNRMGNLLLYKFDATTSMFVLSDELRQPHGHFGVNVLNIDYVTDENFFMRSAGHDGALRSFIIWRSDAKLKMQLRHTVPVRWIEHVFKVFNLEIVIGFCDKHIVIWSTGIDFFIRLPCGGGHRCFDYILVEAPDGRQIIYLLFIKNKTVMLHKCKLFNLIMSKMVLMPLNYWHVRPCNNTTVLEKQGFEQNLTFLISAGDDNLLKISVFEMLQGCGYFLRQGAELQTHISNIRALKVLPLNAHESFIFTGGGRAQLCVTRHITGTFFVEEVVNYTLKMPNQQQCKGYILDPETRIMCIDAMIYSADTIIIYVGCSDGFVRRLLLQNQSEIIVEAALYIGQCVLQTLIVERAFVLIAGTDGHLRLYELMLNYNCLEWVPHASGINALDVLFEEEEQVIHVLSGGDDQLVTYSSIRDENEKPCMRPLTLHTAQVTAAYLRRIGTTLYAFTAGVDQNLIMYDLTADKLVRSFHSCVADVKGIYVGSNQRCFIYGCGLQICDFQVPNEEKQVDEENQVAEGKQVAEENQVAEGKQVAEEKQVDEKQVAEEKQVDEEKQVTEEKQIAEEKQVDEEKQVAEEKQVDEEKQKES